MLLFSIGCIRYNDKIACNQIVVLTSKMPTNYPLRHLCAHKPPHSNHLYSWQGFWVRQEVSWCCFSTTEKLEASWCQLVGVTSGYSPGKRVSFLDVGSLELSQEIVLLKVFTNFVWNVAFTNPINQFLTFSISYVKWPKLWNYSKFI